MLGILYIVMGLLYLFPAKYLIKAGKSLKAAVETEDKEKVEEGIRNTKGFYKFRSILIIASFALTIIVVIEASIDSISAAM